MPALKAFSNSYSSTRARQIKNIAAEGTGTDPCHPEVFCGVEIMAGRQVSLPVPVRVASIAFRIHFLIRNAQFMVVLDGEKPETLEAIP
jgi:hypothetical protein